MFIVYFELSISILNQSTSYQTYACCVEIMKIFINEYFRKGIRINEISQEMKIRKDT